MNNMKNKLLIALILPLTLVSCKQNVDSGSEQQSTSTSSNESINYREGAKENVDTVLMEELKASFDFFYETANTTKNSPAYGLIPDRYNVKNNASYSHCSIASVGYGLALIPVAVEYGWISYDQGKERVEGTLRTLLSLERTHGFYYHFVNMQTGKRHNDGVEVSIIDTAILINGVLVAGKYFENSCYTMAENIYKAVEWDWYYNPDLCKFYMGYSPEKGFEGTWNGYAEQLQIMVLAAGSPTHPVSIDAYNVMKSLSTKARKTPYYDEFYLTYTGSLFTYQFSHAFIDFRNKKDESGIDWFENSVNATKAAIYYAETMQDKYKTYSTLSWGFTACDGPNGYTGAYGIKPCSGGNLCDGTVPPCGAIGSLVFLPDEVIATMKNYKSNEKLWSKYGFIDAYNLGVAEGYTDSTINIGSSGWYASDVIGIDKGISALMIENYISGMIWNITNNISYYQDGLNKLNIK